MSKNFTGGRHTEDSEVAVPSSPGNTNVEPFTPVTLSSLESEIHEKSTQKGYRLSVISSVQTPERKATNIEKKSCVPVLPSGRRPSVLHSLENDIRDKAIASGKSIFHQHEMKRKESHISAISNKARASRALHSLESDIRDKAIANGTPIVNQDNEKEQMRDRIRSFTYTIPGGNVSGYSCSIDSEYEKIKSSKSEILSPKTSRNGTRSGMIANINGNGQHGENVHSNLGYAFNSQDGAILASRVLPAIEGQIITDEDPKKQNNGLMMYGSALIFFVFILCVAITVPITLKSFKAAPMTPLPTILPSSSPSEPPTTDYYHELFEALVPISGRKVLEDQSSPQYKALLWIEEQHFNTTLWNFVQRYVLAVFYFATKGDNWTYCSRYNTECLNKKKNYLSEDDECTWYGNTCNEDRQIKFLRFIYSGDNLQGTLPDELSKLTMLERLDLPDNKIGGFIPTTINLLTNLKIIMLDNNAFYGPFPDALFELRNLQEFSVRGNEFNGPLISRFSEIISLKELDLSGNKFTGTIHSEFALLTNLEKIYIGGNELTGRVPTELLTLKTLKQVFLYSNLLSGTIPNGFPPNITHFNMTNNYMHGRIPEVFFSLSHIELIGLGMNNLSGPVSSKFGNLEKLEKLELSHNQFTGSIPSELGNLELDELFLHGNYLNGTMPPSLCYARGDLQADLQKLTADCAGGDPEVLCDCCSECF